MVGRQSDPLVQVFECVRVRSGEKVYLGDRLIRKVLCLQNTEMVAPSIWDVREDPMAFHDHRQRPAGIAMRGDGIAQAWEAAGVLNKFTELCIGRILRIRHAVYPLLNGEGGRR